MAVDLVLAGFVVGVIVGLTGVGGGSLMAPLLIVVFRMNPLVVVGTDLLYSAPTRAVGALVHGLQGTLLRGPSLFLAVGGALGVACAAILLAWLDHRFDIAVFALSIKHAIGILILISAVLLLWQALVQQKGPRRGFDREYGWLALTALGLSIGLIVTITSVGAGALTLPILNFLFPRKSIVSLVGTDLLFAAVVTVFGAIVQLRFGHANFSVAMLLLAGSIPGVLLGGRFAAIGQRYLKPVVAAMLFMAGWGMA